MNMLAQAMALQAASEAIKHQEEKRKIAQFCRLNATTQRNLPHLPDDVNPLNLAIGMVNAITSSKGNSGDSGGSASVSTDAGAGQNSAGGGEAPTVASPAASQGSQGTGEAPISQGAINQGSAGVIPSGSSVTAAAGGASDSRRPRNWAIPWIVATGASILGAGGVGFGISNSINRTPPTNSTTVIDGEQVNAQYPVVDWIQENGWHRK